MTDYSHAIRDVTEEEVEFFDRNGWVFVPDFVNADLIAEVRQHFMDWSGIHALELPDDPAELDSFRAAVDAANSRPGSMFAARKDDPWIFDYLRQRKLAEAVSRMLNVPSIKMFGEYLFIKLPESSGRGMVTPWHQDFPNLPCDRSQVMQMWTALVPISVDMGPMVHLSGSHREPPGGIFGPGTEDARDVYPEIFEKYEVSEPRDYNPGDAMFHHCLTWHHAGLNKTDKLRWATTNQRMSSNVRYTGQPSGNTDGMGLIPGKTFEHPDFPTVYS